MRFSYWSHCSGFSEPESNVLKGEEDAAEGELRRIAGACWDKASAAAGDS